MVLSDKKLPYLLIAPAFLYLIIIMLVPLSWAIYISFTDKTIGTDGTWIGFANYTELLQDNLFRKSVWNTLLYTFYAVTLKMVLGMIMALILNQAIRARNLFRALLLLPWTLPTFVSILIWRWIFSDTGGVMNHIFQSVGFIRQPLLWLGDAGLAFTSIVTVNVWRGMPFIGITLLAGLQSIPRELYESAAIDGANAIKRFWHITLPMLSNLILLTTVIITIWTLNNFDVVYLLTNGGPANATYVISLYSYQVAFTTLDLAKAIAVSVLFLPVFIVLVNFVTKWTLASDE
jgi:multiple sugar transport system permease protein